MPVLFSTVTALLLATQTVTASFSNNLAFRSPYLQDDLLAVDTQRIARRALKKRDDPLTVAAPDSGDQSYAKYFGEVDHSNSDVIWGGSLNFTHGIASGDPYDTSLLFWTRAVPNGQARLDIPACVKYTVSKDQDMGDVLASGTAYTAFDIDWTVKVEATGLEAETYYYYQFSNCAIPEEKSDIGRTKTAPAKDGKDVGLQRFAIYSCSNYATGFFNSYGGPVANDDVDYVVHVGDYIYEYGVGGAAIGRVPDPPKELATLLDYRTRYAQHRTDPDLLASHKMFPWIAIWDDHETSDNDWKAGSMNSNDTASGCSVLGVCFTERAANAKRAYFEWIPIRQVDLTDKNRIWRQFNFGDLIDIIALDTRKYDRDITTLTDNTAYVASLAVQANSSRSITGPDQREWFLDQLDQSKERGTKWRLVLNQVLFGSVNHSAQITDPKLAGTFSFNYDHWDGYQADRRRVLDHIYDNKIDNVVVVTGDSHSNWLLEVNKDVTLLGEKQNSRDPAIQKTSNDYVRGQVIEFAGTAVSSSGYGSSFNTEANSTATISTHLLEDNAGLLWTEGFYRGYMNVYISPNNVTTTYWAYPDNQIMRTQNRTRSAQFSVKHGMNQVTRPLPETNFGARKAGNY